MAKSKLEVWVCVDAQGDYGTGSSEEAAKEQYAEDIGPLETCGGFKLYQMWLTVPLPEILTVTGEIAEDAAEGSAVTLTVGS